MSLVNPLEPHLKEPTIVIDLGDFFFLHHSPSFSISRSPVLLAYEQQLLAASTCTTVKSLCYHANVGPDLLLLCCVLCTTGVMGKKGSGVFSCVKSLPSHSFDLSSTGKHIL